MRELADGEAEEDGHVGGRHPGRDIDSQDPEQPLPYPVAHPRRHLPLLPREQEDPNHDYQHGEGEEEAEKTLCLTFHFYISLE